MRGFVLKCGGYASLLAALTLLACAPASADTTPEVRAVGVLSDRYESIFRASSRLLSVGKGYQNLSEQELASLWYPFTFVLGALESRGARTEALGNAEAVLVGAKDFHPPRGLGQVHSQVCFVVVLRERNSFELRRYFQHVSTSTFAGLPEWTWSVKLGEFGEDDPKPSALYASQVGRSYILISNDRAQLQAIAEELASPAVSRDKSLKEWDEINGHEVWGYRRYRHSSVIDPMASGMKDVPPGAEALIFFADLGKKQGVLRLICSPADEATAANLNAHSDFPRLRRQSQGVWEAAIPLTGDEKSFERLFVIMGLFGFGLYV